MHIINARLRNREGLHDLHLEHGRIASITQQGAAPIAGPDDLDAAGNLVVPPFVEPHIHLDATLTAGEPRWNMSGTLFEGIECWGERKATITLEDTKTRAKKPSRPWLPMASSMCAPMSTSPTRTSPRSRPCSKCARKAAT